MEGVAENDLRADLGEFVRSHRLHGPVGADRHEDRRFDRAVIERQRPSAGAPAGRFDGKRKGHGRILALVDGVSGLGVALEETGVAVAEEAVAAFHGVTVGFEDALAADKSRDEHEKRRLRKVKVRHERVDDLEFVAGRNEERRVAGAGFHMARTIRRALERAKRGRADRDDAAAFGLRAVDRFGHVFGHAVPLGVHMVFRKLFDAHGLEGPRPDVKRHVGDFNALGLQARKELFREVKPRRRGRHGARVLRVHRLIAGFVVLAVFVLNVGRKRHVALFVEDVEDGTLKGEFEELSFAPHDRHDGVPKKEFGARLRGLARAKHRNGVRFVGDAFVRRSGIFRCR